MEENITRIGVSLPRNLLEEFDSIILNRGYSSRSEAIRDAIRNYILEYKWMEREEGEAVGVVNILYNHSVKGINDAIVALQHDFHEIITSSIHIHLSHEMCLEMVMVRGDMSDIRRLVDRVSATKGVINVKLITALKE
ncbi:nickel-responsive transcriptional regulator NikR [Geoglobus acetivorans]|uniref:Putative nickel-responsive regulator n=1 Tax=Geoglobus acetivorans TaxID=565033 RepID=A0ABZ3H360_GEOAI|nr:nickel-responsive transcriptional regulator NikR [Geoglobus acetivorans]